MGVRCLKCMKEHEEGISKCPFCGYIEGAEEDEQCYLPPRTVLKGRYMIGCCLGSGGFGVTYVAWDSLLEKKVAIKEYLPSELATRTIGETRVTVHDTDCVEKYQQGKRSFLEESRRLAKFNSVKGIVSIFDCFDENDTAYLVMECLEGKTLQQIINERKKIPFKEALPIFVDILEALEVVHAAGMMHRDIAPDNIFVCNDGTAKLIDFGAARFMTTTHSRSLSMILKIGYAPIEQYTKHGNQGPWTDIYAVAASLYHAVTGVVPPDSYDRVEEDKLRKPSLMARHLPKHAETAILNALNIIETNRTPSAKQFAEELSGDLDVERIREKIQHEDTGRIAKWMKYTAAGFALAIVAFAVLYVSTGGALFRSSDYDVPEGMSRVPYVISEFVSDADTKLTKSSLHMVIGDRVTDSYFDNNYVLTQNPRSGNVAYVGSVVSVTASMKPDEYFIPDLSNYTKDYAVEVLEAAGFIVNIKEGSSDTVAPNAVIEQTPPGNTIVFEGSEVTLVINKKIGYSNSYNKLVKVSDYVGMQFDKAQEDALSDGLYMAIIRGEYSDSIPAGEIIEQSPAAGGTLYSGNTVYVSVSLGKRTIIVPNLLYLSEEDALAKIKDRLLTANVKYVEDTTVQEGLVLGQVPASGVSIYENGEVTIYISSGYKVAVPDVVGKKQEDAQNVLANLRLGYAVVLANSDTVPKGTVMEQSVEKDTLVAQGTIITLTVSAGKDIIYVTGVTLNATDLTLKYGEIYTMVATITPRNATTTAVSWTSSNEAVASVDSVGVITAKGVGTTVITVTTRDGNHTAQCTVTVVKELTGLSVTAPPTTSSYYLDDTADLSGLVVTAAYSDGSTENVTKSANIGTIDLSSVGKKVIPVKYSYGGITLGTSFDLHVRELDYIKITSEPKKEYEISETVSYDGLAVKAYYKDGASRNVQYTRVDEFSTETGSTFEVAVFYTEGYETRSATYQVRVAGNFKMSPTELDKPLDNGGTYRLSVSYENDPYANLNLVEWTSSNPEVISIVETSAGVCDVLAKNVGTATITAYDMLLGQKVDIIIKAYGPEEYFGTVKPDESVYEITKTITQTRYRDYRTICASSKPAAPSGFYEYTTPAYSHTETKYGDWSGWQDQYIADTDANEVKTQEVDTYKTQYKYYRFHCSWIGSHMCKNNAAAYHGTSVDSWKVKDTGWLDNALTPTGETWTHRRNVCGGCENPDESGNEYYYNYSNWYWYDTQKVKTGTKTQYSERKVISVTDYYRYYFVMNDWSAWSDTIYTAYERDFEARVVDKPRTLYYAKRKPQ